MKRPLKAQHEQFFRDVCARMAAFEEIERETDGFEAVTWRVQTRFGPLLACTCRNEIDGVFTVTMRFEADVAPAIAELGREEVGLSGKWNIHEFSPAAALAKLESHLKRAGAAAGAFSLAASCA